MEFQVPLHIEPLPEPIRYGGNILLVGSCFTEHIGDKLQELKFDTLQNPHGILFDPASVAAALTSYTDPRIYTQDDLVYLNEVWQSWSHHGRFSGTDPGRVLAAMNASQAEAHQFLGSARWVMITLGTAFSYRLADDGRAVANCHRAPAQWFHKHLMTIEEIKSALDNCIHRLFHFNPDLQLLFTVSPVRHIRDGVVDNNRSKARLIEVVHHLVHKFDRLYYFPAYELVVDVLRDYRFYDADLVHPNYAATQYVLEKFMAFGLDEASRQLAEEIQKIAIARRHKPFHPTTEAHRKFLHTYFEKTKALQDKYPFLSLGEELAYFSGSGR